MYEAVSDIDTIEACVRGMSVSANEAVMVLIADRDAPDLTELSAALSRLEVEFLGGVVPAVIEGSKQHDTGFVTFKISCAGPVVLVEGLDRDDIEMPSLARSFPTGGTALILVDGLAASISSFLSRVYGQLGTTVSYLGGGAGSLTLQQRPCLFSRHGVHQDAAIMLPTALRSQPGVRHGWATLAGPFIVTRSCRNVIEQLDWQNALDVYAEVVEADSGRRLTLETFFDIAKAYPFGLLKEGQEDLVRDPISMTPSGQLVCVGEVPENAVVSILRGDHDSLVAAASSAARDAVCATGGLASHGLVIDCISRAVFLQDGIHDELSAVADCLLEAGVSCGPLGAMTLGEISSRGDGYLEFLNKTMVVGVLYPAQLEGSS